MENNKIKFTNARLRDALYSLNSNKSILGTDEDYGYSEFNPNTRKYIQDIKIPVITNTTKSSNDINNESPGPVTFVPDSYKDDGIGFGRTRSAKNAYRAALSAKLLDAFKVKKDNVIKKDPKINTKSNEDVKKDTKVEPENTVQVDKPVENNNVPELIDEQVFLPSKDVARQERNKKLNNLVSAVTRI